MFSRFLNWKISETQKFLSLPHIITRVLSGVGTRIFEFRWFFSWEIAKTKFHLVRFFFRTLYKVETAKKIFSQLLKMKILKIITKISIFNKDIIQYHMRCLFSKKCVINANDIFIYKIKMGKLFFLCAYFLAWSVLGPHHTPPTRLKWRAIRKRFFNMAQQF